MDETLRAMVRLRAFGRCEYCRLPDAYSQQVFEVDHIIAKKHNGKTNASNLAWTCFACNNRKGTDLSGICPITQRIVNLFHPRRHKWSRHFQWRGGLLVGKTLIGRATIATLQINLPYRVAVRESLIEEGVFSELV